MLAFAEAILPGSSRTPGADESTVARVDQLAGEILPQGRAWFYRALFLLDQAARLRTGSPFHALSRTAQDETLLAWENNPALRGLLVPVSFVFKIVHFDQPQTIRALGGKLPVLPAADAPRWERQIHRAADWRQDTDVECDVVVVGTGAGGAVVGTELAKRGLAVVFIEEGAHYRRQDFRGSVVHAHSSYYRNTLALGSSPVTVLMGKLVGGSTAINGGTCLRPPAWVLDECAEKMDNADLSAAALEPVFERVEATLGVAMPERRFIGPLADVVDRGAKALGWHVGPIPRNAIGCEGQGFCDYGCATGARKSVDVSYLPTAYERGAMVLAELRADKVIMDGGRAVGIEAYDANGRRFRVRGKAVILAGGAVPTPLMLLRQGLANSSGEVGKNLTLHPSGGIAAQFDELLEPERYIPQAYMVDEFLRDGWIALAAQPDLNIAHMIFPTTGRRLMRAIDSVPHLGAFGILLRDEARGRVWFDVGGVPAMTYNMTRGDVARMHRAFNRMGDLAFASGARRVHVGVFGGGVIESRAELERFKERRLTAGDLALISFHPLGTCKMGRDPRTSVIGLDHECHDVPGLFLVDGSSVPGPPGVNPQIMIMAMATQAADKIAAKV